MEDTYIVFKSIIDPLFIIFVLLIIAFFFCLSGRKKDGAMVLFLSIILLYGAGIGPTASYLGYHLEKDYLHKAIAADKKMDAIVVLGGGANDIPSLENTFPTEATAARVLAGVVFYFQNGARYFVCSGKGSGKISEAEVMAGLAQRAGVPKGKIRTEAKSQNTWEHALELNKMFADKDIVLGIVTSACHLKRSEKEFKKYFKNVVPLPADYLYFSPAGNAAIQYIPQTPELYRTFIALHEITGQWWYDLKSY